MNHHTPEINAAQYRWILFVLMGYALSLQLSIALMGFFQTLGMITVSGMAIFSKKDRGSFKTHFFEILRHPMGKAFWGLILAIVVSLLIFSLRGLPVEIPNKDFYYPYRKLSLYSGFIWFSLLWMWLDEKHKLEPSLSKALSCTLWVSLFASIIGCIQYWVPFNLFGLYEKLVQGIPDSPYYHAVGLVGFHLSYAGVLALPCGIFLSAFVFRMKGYKGTWMREHSRTLLGAVSLLSFLALFFTWSKIAWLSIPIMLITLAFLVRPVYAIITTFLCTGGSIFLYLNSEAIRTRLYGMWSYIDRLALWKANWQIFKDYPVFGTGFLYNTVMSRLYLLEIGNPEKRPFIGHPHNNFFDFLSGTGLVGFSAFLLFWFFTFKCLWELKKIEKWKWLALGIFVGLVGFHIQGLAQSNFTNDSKVTHSVLYFLSLAFVLHQRSFKEPLQ